MTNDPTPQGLPINPNIYIRPLRSSPDRICGWEFADHPDGSWRPIPAPQAKPPFPPAADELSDEQLLQMAAKALGYESIDPGEYEPSVEAYGSELIAYGRAAIAADCIQRSNALQPVAWCRSDEFHAAKTKHQSFNGWREQHGDCDMALYADSPTSADSPLTIRYEFEIKDQDGLPVASGAAATLEEAEREGRHYLAQYQQDGPCLLELRRVKVVGVSSPGAQPELPLWRVMLHAYDSAPAPLRDAPDDWTDRQGYAAEILAVRDRVAPDEPPPVAPTDSPAWLHWQQRQAIRALLTTEATRAEAGE